MYFVPLKSPWILFLKKWGNLVNSSRHGQNGRHFADNIFKCIFLNEKFCTLIQISLKFVFKVSIDNKSALVQVMACGWIGSKPLSEPVIAEFTNAYMQRYGEIWVNYAGYTIFKIDIFVGI